MAYTIKFKDGSEKDFSSFKGADLNGACMERIDLSGADFLVQSCAMHVCAGLICASLI